MAEEQNAIFAEARGTIAEARRTIAETRRNFAEARGTIAEARGTIAEARRDWALTCVYTPEPEARLNIFNATRNLAWATMNVAAAKLLLEKAKIIRAPQRDILILFSIFNFQFLFQQPEQIEELNVNVPCLHNQTGALGAWDFPSQSRSWVRLPELPQFYPATGPELSNSKLKIQN